MSEIKAISILQHSFELLQSRDAPHALQALLLLDVKSS